MTDLTRTHWASLTEYNAWWRENGIAMNRLAVTDPDAWERLAANIERSLAAMKARGEA